MDASAAMDAAEENDDENQFQACFILRAPLKKEPEIRKRGRGAAVDPSEDMGKSQQIFAGIPPILGDEPAICVQWRMQAFWSIWRNIEKLIQDTLKREDSNIFKEIYNWICNRKFYDAQINLFNSFNFAMEKGCSTYDISSGDARKRLDAALLILGTIDSSDCMDVFDSFIAFLKGTGCHVSSLKPYEVSNKGGVGNTLRSLFRQFIRSNPETTDMEILATWYHHQNNKDKPLIVIVEDAERCNGAVLSDLIIILSEWATELPIVLVLGVSIAGNSVQNLLPAAAIGRLHFKRFLLAPPAQRLQAVIMAVLIESSYFFTVDHAVIRFLYNYLLRHDNSITSLTRFLKIACVEHFCKEPLSFLCEKLMTSENEEELQAFCELIPKEMMGKLCNKEVTSQEVAALLWKQRAHKKMWGMAVKCIAEIGRHSGIPSEEILYKALSSSNVGSNDDMLFSDIISKLRNLPITTIKLILEGWKNSTHLPLKVKTKVEDIESEILKSGWKVDLSPCQNGQCGTINRLEDIEKGNVNKSLIECSPAGAPCCKPTLSSPHTTNKKITRGHKVEKIDHTVGSKFIGILQNMCRSELAGEPLLLHKITCFEDITTLKQALVGETRKSIHEDLLNSCKNLQCTCCFADGSLGPSMHDTCTAYVLSQEHNDFINVHDWFQSFSTISLQNKRPNAAKHGKSPRKDGKSSSMAKISDQDKASIQARFSRAATELQISGLLRIPKRQNTDFVQRHTII